MNKSGEIDRLTVVKAIKHGTKSFLFCGHIVYFVRIPNCSCFLFVCIAVVILMDIPFYSRSAVFIAMHHTQIEFNPMIQKNDIYMNTKFCSF